MTTDYLQLSNALYERTWYREQLFELGKWETHIYQSSVIKSWIAKEPTEIHNNKSARYYEPKDKPHQSLPSIAF